MDSQRKKALKESYKHYKATMGVVSLLCKQTGDEFVETALDIDKVFNSHYAKLQHKWHPNKSLMSLWELYGKQGFDQLVLFEYEESDDDQTKDIKAELETYREAHLLEHPQAQKMWGK